MGNIDISTILKCAFSIACDKRNTKVLRSIIKHPEIDKKSLESCVFTLGKTRDLNCIKVLSENDCIDPTIANCWVINEAYNDKRFDIFIELLRHSKVSPEKRKEYFFKLCRDGEIEFLKKLVIEKLVNPSDPDIALILACAERSIHKLEPLIKNHGISEKSIISCLKLAVKKGYLTEIKTLLEDNRIDPSIDESWIVKEAYEKKFFDILVVILQNPKSSDSDRQKCFSKACLDGELILIQTLINSKIVDPSFKGNYALKNIKKIKEKKVRRAVKKILLKHNSVKDLVPKSPIVRAKNRVVRVTKDLFNGSGEG